MKHIRRFIMLLMLVIMALPGTAALADNLETGACSWIYTEDYIVPLGTLTADDCASMLFDALSQYGLEEAYGTWNQIGLYVDNTGDVYSATLSLDGGLDWQRAGNVHPDNAAPAEPARPLTLDEIFIQVAGEKEKVL